jgi:hypothetical protein
MSWGHSLHILRKKRWQLGPANQLPIWPVPKEEMQQKLGIGIDLPSPLMSPCGMAGNILAARPARYSRHSTRILTAARETV